MVESQNKIVVGCLWGRKSGKEQKEAKRRRALAIKCSAGDQCFVRARESESLLLAAAVAQPSYPCQKARNCQFLSLQHPCGAFIAGYRQFGHPAVHRPRVHRGGATMLRGKGSTSPILTHPPKSCLEEIGCSHCLFSLAFLIKSELTAECLVESGQINLLWAMLSCLPTSIEAG